MTSLPLKVKYFLWLHVSHSHMGEKGVGGSREGKRSWKPEQSRAEQTGQIDVEPAAQS